MSKDSDPEENLNENDLEFVAEETNDISVADKFKKLQEKIKKLETEKQEYLDGWQRARADYSNLVKSTEEDKKQFKKYFTDSFVESLIPVVDSFTMAMSNKEAWEKVDNNWRMGVEYIYNQLMNILKDHGLILFGMVGDDFDPTFYEAVSEENTNNTDQDHKVAKVIQPGFKIADSILRPARVIVFTLKS